MGRGSVAPGVGAAVLVAVLTGGVARAQGEGSEGTLYVSACIEGCGIARYALDGTFLGSVAGTSGAFALDLANGNVYFGGPYSFEPEVPRNTLMRCTLTGADQQTLLDEVTLQYVDVDPFGAKVYFTDGNGPADLKRAALDGSGVETLVTGDVGAVDVDPIAARLWWVEGTSLRRGNLDASGAQTILSWPDGILDFAVQPGHAIFLAVPGAIVRAALDGSGAQPIVDGSDLPGLTPFRVAVDQGRSQVYFTGFTPTHTGVWRVSADGSGLGAPLLNEIPDQELTLSYFDVDLEVPGNVVPATSPWGLAALGAGLLLAGSVALHRRRR
jgi:hypothetical protein